MIFPGVVVRRHVVHHLAGGGRVDVHGVHPEPVRHLTGPLPGGHAARLVPLDHELGPRQASDRRSVGFVLLHLLPAAGRVEGPQGRFLFRPLGRHQRLGHPRQRHGKKNLQFF